MSVTRIMLGGKSVRLHAPYAPSQKGEDEFVGRTEELRLLLTGWISGSGRPPFAPLLIGQPGVGKTRLAYEAARLMGRELYVFAGNDDVTAQELVVSVVSSGSDSDHLTFEYALSPLATAMVRGGVCLIDELGELRPSALGFLLPLLDGQNGFYSPILGVRITADPRFRFVGTMNHTDRLAALLSSQDKYGRRLRPVIELGEFSADEIRQLIYRKFPAVKDQPKLLRRFWKCWRRVKDGTPPTPWDAIYLFGIAENIAAAERVHRDGSWETVSARDAALQPRHIEAAFEKALTVVRSA